MSSIGARLLESLRSVERSGDFCVGGIREVFMHLDLTTERRGSPHVLVATKNQASYQRRANQRRQDLEHVSALGG